MVADFKKKQKSEVSANKIVFKVAGILFIIIIAVLIVADIKIYQKKKELVAQINNYKRQIEEIQKSSQNLKAEIANSDNQDYIEKIAYEQLGEQKPGEKEVIFVTPPDKKVDQAVQLEDFWSAHYWFGWLDGPWQWLKSKI